MMKKLGAAASIFAIIAITCIPSYAKETTIREFLTWERPAQDSFFAISILTAAAIATQIRPDFADCISGWYAPSNEGNAKRNTEMLGIMEKYPDLIPSGIVVAVLQKECGNFGDL